MNQERNQEICNQKTDENVQNTGEIGQISASDENAVQAAEQNAAPPKKLRAFFSAKKIAFLGVLTALAFAVQFLEIPLFPAAPFLKLDFSNVFVMLVGFLFGPVEGIIVCVLKETLHIPLGSTGGVGELANILVTVGYLLLPATVYRFKKGLKTVIICLIFATLIMTALALPVNRFINFPFFMGEGAEKNFRALWQFLLYFNLIKGVSVSVLCCVLYKFLSKTWHKFN